MVRVISICFLLIFSGYLNASSISDARITRVHLNANGFVYIEFSKSRNSECPGSSTFFVVDPYTEFGKLQYTQALSSFHAQSQVFIRGTGQCASPHEIETIDDFRIYK